MTAIPILKEHLNFLFEQYSRYSSGGETRPEEFVDMFTTAWTRNAIARVVEKGLCHLTQVSRAFPNTELIFSESITRFCRVT